MIKKSVYLLIFSLFFSFLGGCLPKSKEPVKPEVLPAYPYKKREAVGREDALALLNNNEPLYFIDDISRDSLISAAKKNLTWLYRLPEKKEFQYGPLVVTAGDVIHSLELFIRLVNEFKSFAEFNRDIKENFHILRSIGRSRNGSVLFTGYYEPILKGSYKKTGQYKYPIYGKPKDLIQINLGNFRSKLRGEKISCRYHQGKIIPYYSRRNIDTEGILSDKNLEIVWLDDPIELFFLHIEGSGLIIFENGTSCRVNYAAQNGRPYRSIGKLLIKEKKLLREKVSMDSLKNYLKQYPGEMERIFNYNESYIFFRTVEKGPLGCLGFPLTPGRSIATDRRFFPSGALAFIVTEKPLLNEKNKFVRYKKFSRFVFNQDTGGAITGPGRVDLFFGTGEKTGSRAGYVKNEGELYFLIAKNPGKDN